MRKLATLLIVLSTVIVANPSDWRCNQAGAAMGAVADESRHADGVNVFLVSDSFLFILATCPNEFFRSMAAQPDVFNGWLGGLESKSGFTVTEKETADVEQFLSNLQRLLARLRLRDKGQEKMRL